MKSIKRLLIVKTSSMGDVIHMLPAVTDISRTYPDIHIDWVVEESFADIPKWHPAVKRVIPVAVRRWRKNLFSMETLHQVREVRNKLRNGSYDLVLDSQGLIKSAIVSSWAKEPIAGMDKNSAREGVASWFYRQRYSVPRRQHAVPRNRQLAAQALDYSLQDMPLDYGISQHIQKRILMGAGKLRHVDEEQLPERFVIFLHAASTPEKEWPVTSWISLGQTLNERGISVLLPWGDRREHANAQVIATGLNNVQVLPRLGLNELAALFLRAEVLVGEDSGLSHMAAALDRPVIALYLVTDPALTGVMGSEVSKICRVKNLEVRKDGRDVERVVKILDNWMSKTS